MSSNVKIVIPVYQVPLTPQEELSVKQSAKVLHNYPICFVVPQGLSTESLQTLVPQAEIIAVSDEWLGRKNGIGGYNRMMMSREFYDLFSDMEYILICQPDVWIFRDELEAWCQKGYDYVGAPWIKHPRYKHFIPRAWLHLQKAFHPQRLVHRLDTLGRIGNGGLSLRRVGSFRNACAKYQKTIDHFCRHRHHLYNEDVFWAVIPKEFKYPTVEEALGFSFDVKPGLLYEMSGKTCRSAVTGGPNRGSSNSGRTTFPIPPSLKHGNNPFQTQQIVRTPLATHRKTAVTQEKKEKEKIDAGKNVQKKKTERYLRPKSAGTSPHSRVSHLTILLA